MHIKTWDMTPEEYAQHRNVKSEENTQYFQDRIKPIQETFRGPVESPGAVASPESAVGLATKELISVIDTIVILDANGNEKELRIVQHQISPEKYNMKMEKR